MSDFDFDLFVIGGGSGGVRAARVASGELGVKVGLAEESRYGGTCVIRGCVPKKLMVFASEYADMVETAQTYGWSFGESDFDWARFQTHMRAELDRLERIYRSLLANSGVKTFDQRATVVGPHEVTLADGTTKTAKHILVATGGRPVRLEIPGAELAMVSDDLFDMATIPQRLLIVGGGYIACEFAGILNGLGAKVTQMYRGAQILRGFDDDARNVIADGMHERGIDLRLNCNVVDLQRDDKAIVATDTKGHAKAYDAVLFATGRNPNTDGLGLEPVGVTLGRSGAVVVDDFSQTAVPSIYAIGDVTNRVNLTPVAIREGMAFVETVFKGNPTPVDHALIPSAVFTQPEMGTVGLSEQDAREQEEIEVYRTTFKPMQTSFAGRPDRVMMKLIVSKASRRVLGCHIVAPHAGEMIQLAGIAVKMGATKEDFDRTVAVHPTMSEEIVTMRNPERTP
jgi:glutathione reductase (NADPH)